jgi:hypothetical protein
VLCRARVVLKTRASCRANGPRAFWTSISAAMAEQRNAAARRPIQRRERSKEGAEGDGHAEEKPASRGCQDKRRGNSDRVPERRGRRGEAPWSGAGGELEQAGKSARTEEEEYLATSTHPRRAETRAQGSA